MSASRPRDLTPEELSVADAPAIGQGEEMPSQLPPDREAGAEPGAAALSRAEPCEGATAPLATAPSPSTPQGAVPP